MKKIYHLMSNKQCYKYSFLFVIRFYVILVTYLIDLILHVYHIPIVCRTTE